MLHHIQMILLTPCIDWGWGGWQGNERPVTGEDILSLSGVLSYSILLMSLDLYA